MENTTLQRIAPPADDRSPLVVSQEIVRLIREEYRLHTAELCALLLCERQWIDSTLRPAVSHIFINRYFREYIAAHTSLSPAEKAHLLQGYYFYSFPALQAFWREHASAERKTCLIDLASYQRGGYTADLSHELAYHRNARPCAREKERHLLRMESLLTEDGYALYLSSLYGQRRWSPAPLPPLSEDLPLTNLAAVRHKHDLHSNTAAMNYLVARGGIRIKLGSRALWLLPDPSGYRLPIAVPAE